jgi:hypothetical protein
METDQHQCIRCLTWQPLTQFSKSKKTKSGHLNTCRRCVCSRRRAAYAKNPEHFRAKRKAWSEKNKQKDLEQQRNRYHLNPEKFRAKSQNYRKNNPLKVELLSNEWRLKNKAHCAAYQRHKYKTNIQSRLKTLISGRIFESLFIAKTSKNKKTVDLLGCSMKQLKAYLESLFEQGMTWENHGRYLKGGLMTWHIDHVIPCAAFDLTDPEQQKKCFHYSNLQPLWAVDNLQKQDKLNFIKQKLSL